MSDSKRDPRAVFCAALELSSPAEQDDYVEQECGDNAELKQHVQALLNADRAAGSLPPEMEIAATIDSPPGPERPGSMIGPFKVLQKIGEGGMGVVYMAEQTRPVARRVALKIIKPGMDSHQVIARFEAERQALAMMDHPNIAKVVDAGATDSGRPYYAMDLVKGVAITQYCDDHRLDTRERLELFVRVCQAVQHAHQKGIIHRDLKPSNVLVAEFDHQAVPKIIDFGVAKATGQNLTERTMFTQYGQIVGTLDYMSPEQAKFNQLDVDTRTDVYSLGVLMYELLTGSTPIDKQRLRSSALEEVLRIIREEEPPRPSTRVHSSDTLPALAAKRKTEPRKLAGLIRDDLDWIAIKALAKERNDRYQTAEALAADIQRHLDHRPIEARRPSMMGRVRRFARRNKVPVALTSLLLLAAVVAVSLGVLAYVSWLEQQRQTMALRAKELEDEQRWQARESDVPLIKQLMADGHAVRAFHLAQEVRKVLAGDKDFEELWDRCTVQVTFDITPAGTEIFYRDWNALGDRWEMAGKSPLVDVTLPRGDLRFRYVKPGYVTREFQRRFPDFLTEDGPVRMVEDWGIPADMVLIDRISADSRNRLPVDLGDFLIDRYETTNRQFQKFVDAGGYERPEYWEHLAFVQDGQSIDWQQAVRQFVDVTGKLGPAQWHEGRFPYGEDDFPVRGVSWFEAAAYAAFVEKSLPTVHHWRRAATVSQTGNLLTLSNFARRGPAARGTSLGIGHFDVYDLAGNVREWCWNEDEKGRRYLCGGAWTDSDYRFFYNDFASPWAREATYGVRCVSYLPDGEAPEDTRRPAPSPIRDFASETRLPIESLLSWFRYDRHLPLNPQVIQTDDPDGAADYRHEVVRIDAAYGGESFNVHLFIPREKRPRYETIVWHPGVGEWSKRGDFSSGSSDRVYIEHIPRSGRIVCQPIYQGTFERGTGRTVQQISRDSPVQARDMLLDIAKDVYRTVDYLLTRPDVDPDRVVYFGLSQGAMCGPAMLAAETRFAAAVLLSGGYYSSPVWQELEPFHFNSHLRIPILMINGRDDGLFPYESSQVPFFDDLGSEVKKHVVLEGHHTPSADEVLREMDQWLRSTLHAAR